MTTWKINFRCALNGLKDVIERKDLEGPDCRVYQMLPSTGIGRRRKRRRPIIHYSEMMNLQSPERSVRQRLELPLGVGIATPSVHTPTTPTALTPSKFCDVIKPLLHRLFFLSLPFLTSSLSSLPFVSPSSNPAGAHSNRGHTSSFSHPSDSHPSLTHYPSWNLSLPCSQPNPYAKVPTNHTNCHQAIVHYTSYLPIGTALTCGLCSATRIHDQKQAQECGGCK